MLVYGTNPTDPGAALDVERVDLPLGPPAAEAARRAIDDTFDRWGWSTEADGAALCVSELVTELTSEAEGRLQLILRQRDDHIRVMVKGSGPACRFHRLTNTGPDRARSFAVIDSMVPLWGVLPREDGDLVWLEVVRS